MLNKILKIAAYGGLLGFGAKKAYDHFKKEEKSSSEKVTEDFQSTPSVDSQKPHLETDNNASEKAQKVEDPIKDVRFKFAIIQQLMAKRELEPIFDYRLFVEEFSYFIDPDFPSSEAGDYMLNLDITQHQLNCVSDLYLSRYSGDFTFLHLPREVTGEMGIGIFPHFDPRNRPADIVPMTTNIIEDLALLPNLKSIYLPKDKPFEILDIRQTGLVKFSNGVVLGFSDEASQTKQYLGTGQGIKINNLILPRVFLEAIDERGITLFHGHEKLDLTAILNEKSA